MRKEAEWRRTKPQKEKEMEGNTSEKMTETNKRPKINTREEIKNIKEN